MPMLKIMSKMDVESLFFCFSKSTRPLKGCAMAAVSEFTAGDTEAACVGSCQTDLFSVLLGIRKSSGKP